ncbi:AAA family ATPase [Candidatus Woesearchaeota archaeon]|nr:AAA family ATPase [Candidatus Woesearchaeota archaeon]
MQLLRLKLHNIRSYTNANIEFGEGITMLSGDIGSGKSTVLLAIEFALFGLLRGELSGNALLRNGTMKGSVELTFKVEKNTYTICRTLKRGKSVEQDSGYLLTNDVKQEATAVELKSKILEVLGYPEELLTKSKNFVYRYTVYTPQEDMKKIIQDTPEERLALLRKVFDIDKYARIAQNASTYTKTLRERKRAMDLVLTDLELKKKQAEQHQQELSQTKNQISALAPQLELARTFLNIMKARITQLEDKRNKHETILRELSTSKAQLTAKQQQYTSLQQDLATLTEQLKQAPPAVVDSEELAKKNTNLTQSLQEKERAIRTTVIKITEIETLKKQASISTQKINGLAQCPTCLQQVTPDHKHTLLQQEKEKVTGYEQEANQHTTIIKQAEQELLILKQELEQLRTKEREAAISTLANKHYEQASQRKKILETHQTTLQQEVQQTQTTISQLEQNLSAFAHNPIEHENAKKQIDAAIQNERSLSIQHATLAQKETSLTKTLKLMQEEIERKERAKKQLEKTQHAHHWLTDYFIPLMGVIEQHVMAKIHHEFNALFQQWFSMLVEDLLSARLDQEFTPIIQQNGYDIDVEHLSGGERTACALAYRLALNKTINSLINNIKTKDLLILDEPTDGFSAEQLDKMRDVLQQLQLKQILLVSHEQKIEGFADKIIRIQKNEHLSTITC